MNRPGTGHEDNGEGRGLRRTQSGVAQHLDLETITAYIGGALDDDEREAVDAHLAGCADCRQELAEIRTTAGLLHQLPRYRPNRSFRIEPEAARKERGNVVWLGRYLPALPALRAAVAAVALLFLGTIVADVVTEPERSSEQNFALEQAPAPTGRDQIFTATATAADLASDTSESSDQAGELEPAGDAANEAPPAAAPSGRQSRAAAAPPTATITPVPSPTPAPAPTPTPVPEQPASGPSAEFPWRVAEIVFGVTLALLTAALIALQRLRRRLRLRS